MPRSVYSWLTAVFFLLGGVGIMQIGFPRAGSDDPILCHDEVMGPGDVCMTMSSGSSSSHSYEELHAEKLAGHGWELAPVIVGGLMLLAGVCMVLTMVFDRRS
ncbi:hypothetical protein [Kutzneria sp. NPDC052558]|uniref:hypothetical protein n=1 Tax=Kutzneria sp. NPDC052558 TaxID=3364121 RepID=UPI0037C8BF5B